MDQTAAKKPPVVEFRNVSVHFGSFTALNDISFMVEDLPGIGEFIAVIGPSGCGKSTVLNLISGLLKPSQGQVLVDGKVIDGLSRTGGMIPAIQLIPASDVLRNVLFGLEVNKKDMVLTAAERMERADGPYQAGRTAWP